MVIAFTGLGEEAAPREDAMNGAKRSEPVWSRSSYYRAF
jgi:hypothetical protein